MSLNGMSLQPADPQAISPSRWLARIVICAAFCAVVAFACLRATLPYRSHRQSFDRLEESVDRLAHLRPSEYTKEEWSFIVGWTQNALSNCCGYRESISDANAFEIFSIEAERRTGNEPAIQTVEWMWDQFAALSKYGPDYANRYRPTAEDRLQEAPHVEIGPPVQ